MQPSEADRAYLWDMLDAARSASELTAQMTFDQFCQDRRTYRAVERELEIVGEAARKVSEPFRAAHPQIPWAQVIAQRNVLAHGYAHIRFDLLWQVLAEHLPTLVAQIELLIPPSPDQ